MKIKIIDLLNLVYEKKAPKKVKYKNDEWEFYKESNDYLRVGKNGTLFTYYVLKSILNEEVEILEDIQKKIEKLNYKYRNMYGNISAHRHSEVDIIDKVNELVDEINKLKENNK